MTEAAVFPVAPHQDTAHGEPLRRPLSLLLKAPSTVDGAKLAEAVAALRDRYEVLRTELVSEPDGGVKQKLYPAGSLGPVVEAVAEVEIPREREDSDHWLRVRHHGDEVLLTASSATLDAASLLQLGEELATLYSGDTLGELSQQYLDVADWLHEAATEPDVASATARTMAAAEPEQPSAAAATALQRADAGPGGRVRRRPITLDVADPAATFLAAWQTVLHRATLLPELTVWVQTDLREPLELSGVPGPLSPRLPVATAIENESTLGYLVDKAGTDLRYTGEVAELVAGLASPRGAFGFACTEIPDTRWPVTELVSGGGVFALDLTVQVTAEGYVLELYSPGPFGITGQLAETLLEAVVQVATAAVAEDKTQVGAAPLGKGEPVGLPLTEAVLPHPTITEAFAAQVAARGEEKALTWRGKHWTYRELDERTDALAASLIEAGVRANEQVCLLLERGPQQVFAMLGVLKAGAGYVPIDVRHPSDRVQFVLADTETRLVVVSPEQAQRAELAATTKIVLDEDGRTEAPSSGAKPRTRSNDDLAYVIYTSGSTGKPKGCAVTDFNVLRLLESSKGMYAVTENEVWALFHSYAFDFATLETWAPLLHGGRLVCVPDEVLVSPEAYLELLAEQGITMLTQTPGAFRGLVAADASAGSSAKIAVTHVLLGGEALDLEILRPWFENRGATTQKVINIYGPTETTVHINACVLTQDELGPGVAHLGGPLPDVSWYVLDTEGKLVPHGFAGELYAGGAGVTRGYVKRADLTADKFLVDPFRPGVDGARMYRTGDLVRVRTSGKVDYAGRADAQVKVRGFRIELGEIESVLLGHDAVTAAVADVRDNRLVAYLVAPGGMPSAEELHAHCATRMPEYMIPLFFTQIDRVPVTVNGKVDRRALPDPVITATEHAELTDPVEMLIGEVLCEVLGIEQVGATDNFFTLGGDSIRLAQVAVRIKDLTGVSVPLNELLTARDVREQAAVLLNHDTDGRAKALAEMLAEDPEDDDPATADITDLSREHA
ncbi:amino acid adenylation domain-containing protein [Crossiella equi]|uniref:Amino acid adenylation domain-containing protein n=1 Tax=Crossiella equi TaxID=130796 RepID=A0ABS5AAZ2_9PSEU|nr:amino acid adenylation domain-containing protein [Crossiella equi]MBP2473364.1 amino acid adenylation domain-containing protein [Crossiella equi]